MTARQTIQPVADTIRKVTDPVKAQIKKPDHPFWRKAGNIFIYVIIPAAQIAAILVPEPYKSILREIVPIVSVAIKGGSKLTNK